MKVMTLLESRQLLSAVFSPKSYDIKNQALKNLNSYNYQLAVFYSGMFRKNKLFF